MQTKLELYQKVTPLAGLGIWERNLLTGETYWNTIVYEIYGYHQDLPPDIVTVSRLYCEPNDFLNFITEAQTSAEPQFREFKIINDLGVNKWVRIRINTISSAISCDRMYGTIEDITIDKQLVIDLVEKEERLRHAFDYAPIGMALVDLGGRWLNVNDHLCNLLGYQTSELQRLTFQDITYAEDLFNDQIGQKNLLDSQLHHYSTEKRYIRKNGEMIWVLLNASLVRSNDGSPLYFIAQVKDITERKNRERELQTTLAMVNLQNDRLKNFAHIVSHNLRSHASNIKMLTDMVSEEEVIADRDEMMQMLRTNTSNLLSTLNDLSEVVDVDHVSYNDVGPVNLLNTVNRSVNALSPSIKKINAKIHIAIDAQLEIPCKKAYLDSILLNLLTNCIKYRKPDNQLTISVTADIDQRYIVLEVTDNGLGIDLDKNQEKIFNIYSTFHNNKDAHGIGLFLVKNQVESLGGSIDVVSSPQKGTKFILHFLRV